MSEAQEKETDEFLGALVRRIPHSSEDSKNPNEDPEEAQEMLQREFGWLNFPKMEVKKWKKEY